MQVGVTQLVVPKVPTTEFIAMAAKAGYEVVELAMRPVGAGDLNIQITDDDIKRIKDASIQHGITLVSMTHTHCSGNLLAGGALQRTSIEETVAALRIARKLGIDCTLHTLGRMRPEVWYEDSFRNAVEALTELSQHCEELNVSIAIEFIWSGFLFSPLEMRQLIEDVGSDYVGFYFDPGNMAVFHFPHHWVHVLGPYIKMVHLKDWKGNALNGTWPALLKGDVDYKAMNAELRSFDYDGPMISEVSTSEATLEETAATIRKIIAM